MVTRQRAGQLVPLSDYRLIGNVEQIGPTEFFVAASALPVDADDARAWIRAGIATSRDEAESVRDTFIRLMGAEIRGAGGRVIDVEDS